MLPAFAFLALLPPAFRVGAETHKDGTCITGGTCKIAAGLEDLRIPALSYLRASPRKTERPMGAKFRNFLREDLTLYWDNGTPEGTYSGIIQALAGTSTLTYEGHSFIFKKQSGEVVVRLTMRKGQAIYVIPPEDPTVKETAFYKKTMDEMTFLEKYYADNGTPWLAYYPRDKPILPIWEASFLGQQHRLESEIGHLSCDPSSSSKQCSSRSSEITLTVISQKPRVFLVEHLLSEFELANILEMGKKTVRRSTVGQGKGSYTSNTRTSRTGWLARKSSPIIDHVFRRFADVLNISESLLHHDKNAENLQIVHYTEGQEYTPHHDFGDSGVSPHSRFLTLFIYIQPAEKGGGTSFPNAFGGRGMKVEPQAGSAILWYNMLPDGNGDELSLHAGMPVKRGEKWGCNLWVWDPSFH